MKNCLLRLQRMFPSPAAQLQLALSAASGLLLAAALVMQYGFALFPCHLCILQRWPYLGVLLLGILALFPRMPARILRLGLLASALLLLTGTGIAGYHAGVEMGIFTGPSGCTSTSGGGESIEELRRQIMEAPLVSCDQPMATFFGLSLAAWNTLVYLFLTFVASYGWYRSARPEHTHELHS